MAVNQTSTPTFKYQFLDVERFPLGNSPEPHPWLVFETDSLDAFTTIYPRTTKIYFLEGPPSDIEAPKHSHVCSINKPGYQYLRDAITAIAWRDYRPVSSRKKICTGESENTKRVALNALASLSNGGGRHLDSAICPIGSLVQTRENDNVSEPLEGIVVDHWKKYGGAGIPVVLLALVADFQDESAGCLRYTDSSGRQKYIYPGIQFLVLERNVKSAAPTGLNGRRFHYWPAAFESERAAISREVGCLYLPATAKSAIETPLGSVVRNIAQRSKTASHVNTTRPSATPAVAVRTLQANDFAAALALNTIAAKSFNDRDEYVRAVKGELENNSPEKDADQYIRGRTALALPMTKQIFPEIRPQVETEKKKPKIRIELLKAGPGSLGDGAVESIREHLVRAYEENKALRFLTYVSLEAGEAVEFSTWSVEGHPIEVCHTMYQDKESR